MVFHDPKPCFEANVLHSTHYGADMTFHKACFHVSMFFHDTLFQMQWTIVTFAIPSPLQWLRGDKISCPRGDKSLIALKQCEMVIQGTKLFETRAGLTV